MKNNPYASSFASPSQGAPGIPPGYGGEVRGPFEAGSMPPQAQAGMDFDIMRLLKRLYRHWFILLALWSVFAAGWFALREIGKPLSFSSRGIINLAADGGRRQPAATAGFLGGDGGGVDLVTQKLILSGPKLAAAVIKANGLNASLVAMAPKDHPEKLPELAAKIAYRPAAKDWWWAEQVGKNASIKPYMSGLRVVNTEVPESMDSWTTYRIRFKDPESFDVLAENGMSVVGGCRLGNRVAAPALDGRGFLLETTGGCRMAKDDEVRLTLGPVSAAVPGFQSALWVQPMGGGPGQTSNLIEVGYSCDSPFVAQQVVKTLMEQYIAMSMEKSRKETDASYSVIHGLLTSADAELTAANKALEDEQKAVRAFDFDPIVKKQMEDSAKAEAQLEEARRALVRLREVEEGFKSSDPPPVDDVRLISLAALGDAVVRGAIDNYRTAQGRLRQLVLQLPDGHPELAKARNEAADAWLSVGKVVAAQSQELDAEVKRLAKESQDRAGDFDKLPEGNRRMAGLLRNVRIYQSNYDSLFAEQTRMSIARDTVVSNYDIQGFASLPLGPGSPSFSQATTTSLGLGFLVAAALVMLPGLRIRWFETAEEAIRVVSQPVFGVLPSTGQRSRRGERKILVQDPNGRWAEAMRLLRTNLMQAMAGRPSQVLMVSGAQPGDGKSTVSANLAVSLAQSARVKSVLLIDADMHRPSLHGVFGVPQSPGLSDYLNGTATLEQIVHQVEIPGAEGKTLSFIPAGPIPPVPSDLVETDAMRELLARARERHMFTLLDTPPYPLVSVAGSLAEHVDRVLAICRIGRTARGLYLRHVAHLARHGAHIGLVFNSPSAGRVGSAQDSYGYEDGYGYGYESYGRGYGAKEREEAAKTRAAAPGTKGP